MSTKKSAESISDLPVSTLRAAFEQALVVSAVICLRHTPYVKDMIIKKGVILEDFSKAVLESLAHSPPEGDPWESGFFYEDFWAENLSEATPDSIRQHTSERILFVESEYLTPSPRFPKLLCQMQNVAYSESMTCTFQQGTFRCGKALRDQEIVFGEGFSEKAKELLQRSFSDWMLSTEEFFYRFLCEALVVAQSLSFLFDLVDGATVTIPVEEIRKSFPYQVKKAIMRKILPSEEDFY